MDGVSVDLNADLGEGGPVDRELLEVVTSASVACGFHAGSPSLMVETARWAADHGVRVGAHPSYADREGFGRLPLDVAPDRLFADVVYQVGAMAAAALAGGSPLAFVKPHGSLYNRAAVDPSVAEVVVRAVSLFELPLLCPPGSQMQIRAEEYGVACFSEAFVDRAYRPDGTLADRTEPGGVITDPASVARRSVGLARRAVVTSLDGRDIVIHADSLCIHGDSPDALRLATAVRTALLDAGVSIRSFLPG